MISLNYRDSRPIYEQIQEGLKKLIVTGALSLDEKLPSVRTLATQLSINPNTIQRAYNALEGEGYIYSVPGKGSFASGAVDTGEKQRRELRERFLSLAAELRFLGMEETELIALVRQAGATVPAEPSAGLSGGKGPGGAQTGAAANAASVPEAGAVPDRRSAPGGDGLSNKDSSSGGDSASNRDGASNKDSSSAGPQTEK